MCCQSKLAFFKTLPSEPPESAILNESELAIADFWSFKMCFPTEFATSTDSANEYTLAHMLMDTMKLKRKKSELD